MIKPLAHFIVAIKEAPEQTTTDGLYLPNDSKEHPLLALVKAVGVDVETVKAGDRIIYKQYETDTEIEKVRYLIIKEEDILAIL